MEIGPEENGACYVVSGYLERPVHVNEFMSMTFAGFGATCCLFETYYQ
jgi:hypothetical protein